MTELELHIATNTLTDNNKAYLLNLLSKVPNVERITRK